MTIRIEGEPLFNRGHLLTFLHNRKKQVFKTVTGVSDQKFQANSDEDILAHCFDKLAVEALQLDEEHAERERFDVQLEMNENARSTSGDAIKIEVTMPYFGDSQLWWQSPRTMYLNPLRGYVKKPKAEHPGTVTFIFIALQNTNRYAIKEKIDDHLDAVRKTLADQKNEIEAADSTLRNQISEAITSRRERVKRNEDLDAILNIPLKKREGTPPIEPIKIRQKIVKPLPAHKNGQVKKEWVLETERYELILKLFRYMTRSWETTPKTFHKHVEQELRDILLSYLNGMFEGEAGAESFRGQGKTDILIKEANGSAFIAECKVWTGPQKASEAIDQLFRYTTWRDCKVALIFFNKKRSNFRAIQQKLHGTVTSHEKCTSEVGDQELGEWRFIFEDQGHPITVHVFLVNLFYDTNE